MHKIIITFVFKKNDVLFPPKIGETSSKIVIPDLANFRLIGNFHTYLKIPNAIRLRRHLIRASTGLATFLSIFYKHICDRCYDYNFLRFWPIFDEKIGVFSKTNVMIKNFA
jgi:hypothetical protein